MKTDYTFTLNQSLLDKAKLYAQRRAINLDSLVESHLIHLILNDMDTGISPFIDKMRSNSVKDGILNYKVQMKEEYES